MKAAIVVLYAVMAVWLLVAAVVRIALQLGAGIDLDPIPFISGGLGIVALLVLLPAYDEWRQRL